MKKRILPLFLLFAFVVLSLTGCVTVVKIGEESALTGKMTFDASQNVADIWDSQALPELENKAVELGAFLQEANGDMKSLADKYGKYSMGDSGELNYVVRGTGTVTEVSQEKKAGYLTLKLDGYDGSAAIRLQIGTVFKGSAVRDSLTFIKYENYQNQVQWAEVSKSIHALLQQTVIDPVDVPSIQGKTVTFVGCFTANSNEELLITPVVLTAA